MAAYREVLENTINGSHTASQDRAYKMPNPPPIQLTVSHDSSGWPFLPLASGALYDPKLAGFSSVDFIRYVNYGDYVSDRFISDWSYENRRTGQRILPFLYLGPTSVTRDLKFLQEHGVTLILAFRDPAAARISGPAPKAAKALGIALEEIVTPGRSEIIKDFPLAINLINAHMTDRFQTHARNGGHFDALPGRVLVTDETGNAEAAICVAAYIMAVHCKDWDNAANIVQAQRFCAIFGDLELQVLITFGQLLQAQRDVVRASEFTETVNIGHVQEPSSVLGPRKRHLKKYGDEDMDDCNICDEMDQSRFENRAILEPFRDTPDP